MAMTSREKRHARLLAASGSAVSPRVFVGPSKAYRDAGRSAPIGRSMVAGIDTMPAGSREQVTAEMRLAERSVYVPENGQARTAKPRRQSTATANKARREEIKTVIADRNIRKEFNLPVIRMAEFE